MRRRSATPAARCAAATASARCTSRSATSTNARIAFDDTRHPRARDRTAVRPVRHARPRQRRGGAPRAGRLGRRAGIARHRPRASARGRPGRAAVDRGARPRRTRRSRGRSTWPGRCAPTGSARDASRCTSPLACLDVYEFSRRVRTGPRRRRRRRSRVLGKIWTDPWPLALIQMSAQVIACLCVASTAAPASRSTPSWRHAARNCSPAAVTAAERGPARRPRDGHRGTRVGQAAGRRVRPAAVARPASTRPTPDELVRCGPRPSTAFDYGNELATLAQPGPAGRGAARRRTHRRGCRAGDARPRRRARDGRRSRCSTSSARSASRRSGPRTPPADSTR